MGNQVQTEDYSQRVIALSKTSDMNKVKEELGEIIPKLPLGSNASVIEGLFMKFDNDQIIQFSNNLCAFMKYLMTEKLTLINQSATLLLLFTSAVYQKHLNIRDLVSQQYQAILEKNANPKEQLEICFPYNIFLYAIEALCDDNFLILKDVFQKEVDKFDYMQKTTTLIFLITNNVDCPITQNARSSVEYFDTIKLFLFPNELFIKQKIIKALITKLYNTTIHNFACLIGNRVDPNIQTAHFEAFLFMNISILLNLCCDINISLASITTEVDQSLHQTINTFNQKSLLVSSKLFQSSSDDNNYNPMTSIMQYNKIINEVTKENLILTSHLFRKFISEFYVNYERLTPQFQIMVKILMIFVFENNPDICEMICLSNELLHLLMPTLKYSNAFDLILLNLITQTKNFHIVMKHLDIKTESICNDCLCTMISNRSTKAKLTYSSYFSLLIVLNLSSHFNEIDDDISSKLNEFYEHFIKSDVNKETYFDNILCITLYYEIMLNFINRVDFPSKIIFRLLKMNQERIKCEERYALFYKNNFELDKKGKLLMISYWKLCEKVTAFIEELNIKIIQDGGDMYYSQDSVIISIINKFSFKRDLNAILSEEEKKKSIFNSDIVKFLISTLHSYEEYTILL